MIKAIFIICSIFILNIFANDSDINSLSLNIKSMKNDLITLYDRPKNEDLKEHIFFEIKQIKNGVKEIAKVKNKKESKNILEYLLYNSQKIKELISKDKISKTTLLDLVDTCSVMFEGLNSLEKDENTLSVNRLKSEDIELLRAYYLLNGNKIENDIDTDRYKNILDMVKTQISVNQNSRDSFIKVLKDKNSFLPNIVYILSNSLKRSIDGK